MELFFVEKIMYGLVNFFNPIIPYLYLENQIY